MRHINIRLALVALVAFVSCAPEGSPTSPASIAAVQEYHDAVCANDVRCGRATDEACTHASARTSYDYARALDRGAVVFDRAAMEACFSAPCTRGRVLGVDPACARIFVAQVGDGHTCTADYECVSGLCSGGGDASCGVCRSPTASLGAACSRNAECAPLADGSVACFGGTGAALCRQLVDGPAASQGSACGGETIDDTHVLVTQCADGLFCAGGFPLHRCTSLPAPSGAPCHELGLDACADGLACLFEGCGPDHLETVAGAPCGRLAIGNVRCDIERGLQCLSGVCQLLPSEVGAACLGDCGAGLVCGMGSWICVAPRGEGDDCLADGECASRFCGAGFRCALPSSC